MHIGQCLAWVTDDCSLSTSRWFRRLDAQDYDWTSYRLDSTAINYCQCHVPPGADCQYPGVAFCLESN